MSSEIARVIQVVESPLSLSLSQTILQLIEDILQKKWSLLLPVLIHLFVLVLTTLEKLETQADVSVPVVSATVCSVKK